MAKIRPFSGLRFDLDKHHDAGSLLAPPYDVIDADGRAELAAKSPHNCVRVILPEGEGNEKYELGAREFMRLQNEALVVDDEAGFYIYHQRFESEGQTFVRKGIVALLELTRFGKGPVLPHERTLSGPKEDRLKLMRACDAHLELVFGLFSDPEHRIGKALDSELKTPVLECDFEGVHHQLYRVSDEATCKLLMEVMADKNIYIADGHHRYETMCAFSEELIAAGRSKDEAGWGMIYLSNLDDPGLVVKGTHRIVHGLVELDIEDVLRRCSQYFEVSSHALPNDSETLIKELAAKGEERASFAITVPKSGVLHTLQLRADFDPAAAGMGELPEALQRLDVALLHELLLEQVLGISKAAQVAKSNLRYFKSTERSLDLAGHGDDEHTQLVCFMNATPVSDVVAVCDSGEVMPQKSTFFYPKIPTGLVFRTIGE